MSSNIVWNIGAHDPGTASLLKAFFHPEHLQPLEGSLDSSLESPEPVESSVVQECHLVLQRFLEQNNAKDALDFVVEQFPDVKGVCVTDKAARVELTDCFASINFAPDMEKKLTQWLDPRCRIELPGSVCISYYSQPVFLPKNSAEVAQATVALLSDLEQLHSTGHVHGWVCPKAVVSDQGTPRLVNYQWAVREDEPAPLSNSYSTESKLAKQDSDLEACGQVIHFWICNRKYKPLGNAYEELRDCLSHAVFGVGSSMSGVLKVMFRLLERKVSASEALFLLSK